MTQGAPSQQLVRVDEIIPHPENPRRELLDIEGLAASIKSVGVLQALVLHKNEDGSITCLLGHRRHAAAKLAGLEFVPASVWLGLSPDEQLEIMMVENVQRKDLSPIEEARAFDSLISRGKSQRVVAERMGVNQSHVSRRLELLKLNEEDQEKVHAGKMTVSKALASLKPKKEKAPAPDPVEVDPALVPDPIDALEPVGYAVLRIDDDGDYEITADGDIYATASDAREVGELYDAHAIPVALVPLPAIAPEASPPPVEGTADPAEGFENSTSSSVGPLGSEPMPEEDEIESPPLPDGETVTEGEPAHAEEVLDDSPSVDPPASSAPLVSVSGPQGKYDQHVVSCSEHGRIGGYREPEVALSMAKRHIESDHGGLEHCDLAVEGAGIEGIEGIDELDDEATVTDLTGGANDTAAADATETPAADDTPDEPSQERKDALVKFAATWAGVRAAVEDTVRESAEREFSDSPDDVDRAVRLWSVAREQMAKAS